MAELNVGIDRATGKYFFVPIDRGLDGEIVNTGSEVFVADVDTLACVIRNRPEGKSVTITSDIYFISDHKPLGHNELEKLLDGIGS